MAFAILFDILIREPFPLLWLTEPLLERLPYLQNESAIEHQHHLLNVFKIIRVIQAIAAGLQPAHSLDFPPSQPVHLIECHQPLLLESHCFAVLLDHLSMLTNRVTKMSGYLFQKHVPCQCHLIQVATDSPNGAD